MTGAVFWLAGTETGVERLNDDCVRDMSIGKRYMNERHDMWLVDDSAVLCYTMMRLCKSFYKDMKDS